MSLVVYIFRQGLEREREKETERQRERDRERGGNADGMQTWQSTAVLPASEFLSEVAKAHGSHSFWKILTLDQALPLLEKGTHPQPSIGDILSILHRSRRRNDRKQVLRLHSYVYRNELEAHTSLGNCFISMFVDVGCIDEAYKAFDALLHRNELSWNTLITGHVRCGKPLTLTRVCK